LRTWQKPYCFIFGIKAKISVTIQEKITVKSKIRATLFPLLLAKDALMINGKKINPKTKRKTNLPGVSNPNIKTPPLWYITPTKSTS
jgi:hypothetical protein